MDPLSMTASIIAVLQLTSTLTSYINEARNATAEQKKVAVEAGNLYGLLTNLRFQVEEARFNDPWFNQVKLLGVPNGPLDQFKGVLESMVKQLPTSRKRDQVKSALLWKFTKKEVEDALARMERLKTLISCALTNDLMALSRAIHEDLETVREQNEQLCTRMDRLQIRADQELQDKLSKWLNIPDPSTNYHAALQKRHPETGQWLLSGQRFTEWKSSTSSLMWLHGSAGCGKTILSAASLHNILQHKESYPDTIVSYFYFDFNDAAKQSSEKAIRSLLFQAALQANDILHDLETLYNQYSGGQQQPAEDSIHSLLKKAMVRSGVKYIILDALDECIDREGLLPFIREVATSQLRDLHILATSRREKDIEDELSPVADHNINIQSAIVDEDIRIYIRDRIAIDARLKKWPVSVQNEIMTALMEKAGGMFRWVFCQLESIRQCIQLKALRKALSSLPKTLDETYNRILQSLDSAGQLQNAIKALQWLCFSNRPLELAEMVEILAIETGDQGGFDPEERLPDPMDVMVVCSTLIVLNPINSNGDFWEDSDTDNVVSVDGSDKDADRMQIRLAHFSVKEFFLSDRCAFRQSFQSQVCHSIVAEGCLRYLLHLCHDGPLTEDLVAQYALTRYAVEEWWQHLQTISRIIDGTLLDGTLLQLTLRFLTDVDASLLSWVQLYDIDSPKGRMDFSVKAEDVAQPLYYAADIGVPTVVKEILGRNIDVNAEGGHYGTALQAASGRGHEAVV
ncbi:NACHT domain-containing protein isoform 2, partial [Cladophialophora immunda]